MPIKWFLILSLIIGCTRTSINEPQKAMRPSSNTPEVTDDLEFKEFINALTINITFLKKQKKKTLIFGKKSIQATQYAEYLQHIIDHYKKVNSKSKIINFIKENFEWHEVYGKDQWSHILLTAYYEPLYQGRLKPKPPYTQPIYTLPQDLVEVDLQAFGDRKIGEFQTIRKKVGARIIQRRPYPKIVPYYSREEIDIDKKLKGKNLELYYLDPIHAFFLQIQGSGVIQLKNGTPKRVSYAGQNGYRYESIGRHLYHIIPKEEMSLQKIEAHLRTLEKEELYQFLNLNPSYVFFKKLKEGRGRTTMGTQVVNGRTLAIDSSLLPLGALAFLSFQKPEFKTKEDTIPYNFKEIKRFVLTQDTGGAIKSAGRADLFWGEGSGALQYAGVMRHSAKLWFLFPKSAIQQKKK